MAVTIPRAELNAIAERYDDTFDPVGEPTVQYLRDAANYYRSATTLMSSARSRESLLAEAVDLDALADRIENERDDHCIAYSENPDTGRCECGHDYDDHGGGPGQCEAPLGAEVTA